MMGVHDYGYDYYDCTGQQASWKIPNTPSIALIRVWLAPGKARILQQYYTQLSAVEVEPLRTDRGYEYVLIAAPLEITDHLIGDIVGSLGLKDIEVVDFDYQPPKSLLQEPLKKPLNTPLNTPKPTAEPQPTCGPLDPNYTPPPKSKPRRDPADESREIIL
jgi:hypothetical protein